MKFRRGSVAAFVVPLLLVFCCFCLMFTSSWAQSPEWLDANFGSEDAPKKKKKRGMSLISNILDDMGLNDNQKMMVCMVLMGVIAYLRLSRGSEFFQERLVEAVGRSGGGRRGARAG